MKHNPILTTLVRLLLLIWTAVVIYPLIWMALSSFKNTREIFLSPWTLPASLRFDNFVEAWQKYNIGRSFFNSLWTTVVATVLCLFFSVPSAYAIERIGFKMNRLLLNAYLAAMMIPAALGWIPLFFLLNNMNLLNNIWALAFVYAVTRVPFSIFILCSFIRTVPKELEEAAAIDGMSQYGVLFRLIMPLIRAGVITVIVMNVIIFWSEYFLAMLFIQDEAKLTLGVAMDMMRRNAQYQNAWGALFAGLTIATVPVIVIYACFHKYIVKGMVEGAVKG